MRIPFQAALLAFASLASAASTARNPLQFLAVVEHPSIHTRSHRVNSHSTFDLSLDLYNGLRKIKLSLEPNHDILGQGAVVTYLNQDGSVQHQEPIKRDDHKVFKGTARMQATDGSWQPVGWARINILRDGVSPLFEGAFTVNHDNHHVQMSSSYARNHHELDPDLILEGDDYMVLWRDSDIAPTDHLIDRKRDLSGRYSCKSEQLLFNSDPNHPVYNNLLKREDRHWGVMPIGKLFGKRQIDTQPSGGNSAGVNLVSTIGNSAGCPNTKKVALVGIATDCTYTQTFNSTESTRQNVITQMNTASSLWESSFNISLGLQNLTVSNATCPGSMQQTTPWNQDCNSGADLSDRLNLFSGWRGSLSDTNSHWTLLTNCNTGSAVGLAWLGQACIHSAQTINGTNNTSETVSGANVVAKTPTEWQVIAHETGHTYGAVHDCDTQTCAQPNIVNSQQCCPLSSSTCDAGEQYIMNPTTVTGLAHFSDCSIGNICSGIGRNAINTTCLSDNKGVVTITGQQCGNGIVEPGEDCDCGGVEGCGDDACCEPTTCKFKGSAVCDDANEDCCQNCQFSQAGTICRASTGSCDPAETCPGNSGVCPANFNAPDGQSCTLNGTSSDAGSLTCASGQCTSRDMQCKTVMGMYANNNDTYACDDSTCSMSCASPSFGQGVCYSLAQQQFLDGTPCGGGGACNSGRCQGSSTTKEVGNWINSNKGLVIGVAAGVGGFLLILIVLCIIGSCSRSRKRGRSPKGPPPGPMPPVYGGSWYGPAPGPLHRAPSRPQPSFAAGPGAGWQNNEAGWRPPPPTGPNPLYGGGIIGAQTAWPPPQHASVRYA